MPELVDKHWFKNGLRSYSTAQVLGTLAQYGVVLTEAEVRAELEARGPEDLAEAWSKVWTGRGKFKDFYAAAARLLFVRLTMRGALGEVVAVIDETVADSLDLDEPCEIPEDEARSFNESLAHAKTLPLLHTSSETLRRSMLLAVGQNRPELMKLLARFATEHVALTELIVAHQNDLEALVERLVKLFEDPSQQSDLRLEAGWHLHGLDRRPPRKPLLDLLTSCEASREFRLGASASSLLREMYADELGEHYCPECRTYHSADELSHPEFESDDRDLPF